MVTECSQDSLDFGTVEGRQVVGAFDGGSITSNAGALLLGAADKAIKLVGRLAATFSDRRDPDRIEHSVATLVGQRIFGIALGHEDLNDHDRLRHDPTLAVLAGKLKAIRKDCAPVAGKSTLNRLELSRADTACYYCKIVHDAQTIARLFLTIFVEAYKKPPKRLVLDVDATHDPIHGAQEGRHFSAFYDCYCYLPLYVFCERHLLAAKLRTVDKGSADGVVEEIARIVAELRKVWPEVRIIVRADSGFARDDLMSWCEDNGVDYVLGLARNVRLVAAIKRELVLARRASRRSGKAERRFADLPGWQTRESWSKARRVVAKAEWTGGEANPRFVVTSLHRAETDTRYLYEDLYCARGEMENRFKECQTDLFADRTSAATLQANQLRLWFASFAYVLLCAVRRIGLEGTRLARATCGTIRLKLLKIGALVTTSVRRVKFALASGCPEQDLFAEVHERLSRAAR
jgi:Transposase DDE domain group 1